MAITLSYTFTANTTIQSAQVNSNFTTLATRALDKTGDTMTGDLKFTDATYDIGKSAATRPRDLFLSRNATVGGTLAVTGTADLAGGLSTALSLGSTGQIVFPATQNASVGANTLDDYEEGSWTPVIGGSGGTSGQTYSARQATYVKIGHVVVCTARILFSNKGTITGSVEIQGLPFTSLNTGGAVGVGGASFNFFGSMTTNWIFISGFVNDNSTVCSIYGTSAAAVSQSALVAGDISNSTDWRVTITYLSNA